jgi:hypothetical protein
MTFCPRRIYLFGIYLRTATSASFNILTGFYNGDEKCLLRDTNWAFKQSNLRFFVKGFKSVVFIHA